MNQDVLDGVWYPNAEFVETVVTRLVPILFPLYEITEPDFQFLGGRQGHGLLSSSLARPMPYFGEDRYPTIADKAAALMWSITLNHPFNDGNKRAALTTAFVFIVANGHAILVDQDEAVEMCLRVAANTPGYTEDFIASWLNRNMFPVGEIGQKLSPQALDTNTVGNDAYSSWRRLTPSQQTAWIAFYRAISSVIR